MKELAAYSTLGHLSFITLGIFTFTISGLDGGSYQILNHGISGGALFLLLGFLYERYGTYDMRDYGGLAAKLPWMVTLYVVTTLSLIGLPMLNSFVGEFLILAGSMQSPHHVAWTVLATTGVILSAAYMLLMIQRVFYGRPRRDLRELCRAGSDRARAHRVVAADCADVDHGCGFSVLDEDA